MSKRHCVKCVKHNGMFVRPCYRCYLNEYIPANYVYHGSKIFSCSCGFCEKRRVWITLHCRIEGWFKPNTEVPFDSSITYPAKQVDFILEALHKLYPTSFPKPEPIEPTELKDPLLVQQTLKKRKIEKWMLEMNEELCKKHRKSTKRK